MVTLYSFPFSQHSRRVVSLLEETGIAYQSEFVDMSKGEYQSDAYRAVNPNCQVPTLVDGNLKIHESNAILRYLCVKHQLHDWYPEDPQLRGTIEQWLDWNQCILGPTVVDIVLNQVFLREHGDKQAVERGMKKLPELAAILDQGLEGKAFLAGDRPSIADLSLASNIFHLSLADVQFDNANIQAWYQRVSEREGFRRSLPEMP